MGFWDNISSALNDNRKEIGEFMKQFKHYPEYKLEEIYDDQRYNLQQRAAAHNLLRGELLHLMDEY